MKLFTCGPVTQYEESKINYKQIPYFRDPSFSQVVLNTLSHLSSMMNTNKDDSLIYLASSGTGAMEAVVDNLINNEQSIVINGGTFGQRFCDLLNKHHKTYAEIKIKWNETLTSEHFLKFTNQNNIKDFKFLFINLHETSTGQLYNIELITKFCKEYNIFLIVDAISSFLCDDYTQYQKDFDVSIISSHKGLCLSPGCSFITISNRAKEKIVSENNSKSAYFNLVDYLKNIERGQTPFTPCVYSIYELNNMLNYIEHCGGLVSWVNEIRKKALFFREQMSNKGIRIPDYPLSNMLTPLLLKNITPTILYKKLANEQIYLTPCGGTLKDIIIRVGHIGNISLEDLDNLANKIGQYNG